MTRSIDYSDKQRRFSPVSLITHEMLCFVNLNRISG
jgi:hypothetical protein